MPADNDTRSPQQIEADRRALEITREISQLGAFIRPNQKLEAIDFFVYNVPVTVSAASTVRAVLQTQSNSDFVLCYMASSLVQGVAIQITDLGDGKTMFSQPAYLFLISGQLGFPYVLPCPRVFSSNTNIAVDFVNQDTTNPVSLSLALIGARLSYVN